MSSQPPPSAQPGNPDANDPKAKIPARVSQAAISILAPLARLFVAHGVSYSQAERLLKRAFYQAGLDELQRADIKPNMSRVSVSTGLHRRDVKRLSSQTYQDTRQAATEVSARSLASEIYLRWSTDPVFSSTRKNLPLRAILDKPSFESLARAVNKDAHPRSLLEELRRLGLVTVNDESESVTLLAGGFIPMLERTEMLGLLGENLSAHVATAVANVIEPGPRRLEQAICEQGLTIEAVEQVSALSRRLWQTASDAIVPALTDVRHESDNKLEDDARYEVRIGMYMFTNLPRTTSQVSAPAKKKSRRKR